MPVHWSQTRHRGVSFLDVHGFGTSPLKFLTYNDLNVQFWTSVAATDSCAPNCVRLAGSAWSAWMLLKLVLRVRGKRIRISSFTISLLCKASYPGALSI